MSLECIERHRELTHRKQGRIVHEHTGGATRAGIEIPTAGLAIHPIDAGAVVSSAVGHATARDIHCVDLLEVRRIVRDWTGLVVEARGAIGLENRPRDYTPFDVGLTGESPRDGDIERRKNLLGRQRVGEGHWW